MSGPAPDSPKARMPIETKAQLIEELASGSKPKSAWKIGTEHEKFPFLTDTLKPVPYHGPRSIKALLDGLKDRYGWAGVYEGENIIALSDPNGLGNVSLEPGGQFELSGAPLDTVHETCEEVHEHLTQVREVGDKLGIGFLGLGASPLWSLKETPVMPKGRYGIMAPYMDKVGTRGRDMMFRTCTVQVNLDFSSEADMVKKLRVSLALQPIATALFADSPFLDGKPNGFLSYRSEVWRDTDNQRAGMLPFAFEQGFGFEQYVDYALDVPMYFVKRGGRYIDAAGKSFKAFMDGRLDVVEGQKPGLKDWIDHLSTMFPEVRLKTYLEMRGADTGPLARLNALPALWAGIFYDDIALDAALELSRGWSSEERQRLRVNAARRGLKTEIGGRPLRDVAIDMVAIAKGGLQRRAIASGAFADESCYLAELEEIADSGVTPAERLLERYHGEWGGDVRKVFDELAY